MADLSGVAARLDSTAWIGVGALGLLLAVVGVYQPALAGLPAAGILGIVLALVGASLAVLGFSFAAERRRAERSRPRGVRRAHAEISEQFGPSFEIYDPKGAVEGTPPSGADAPSGPNRLE